MPAERRVGEGGRGAARGGHQHGEGRQLLGAGGASTETCRCRGRAQGDEPACSK